MKSYALDTHNSSLGIGINITPIDDAPFIVIEGKMTDGSDHYTAIPIEPFVDELMRICLCHKEAVKMSAYRYN
jgi:hypothetical protein